MSRRGVRVGIDVGSVRIGVAVSDPEGILATPVATVARNKDADDDPAQNGLSELAAIIQAKDAIEVIVGLPVNLAGREGPAAVEVRRYVDRLAATIAPIPVKLTDERMSTVTATRRLSERGVRGKRRRAVVDQAAAVEILQSWLDAQRRHGGA